MGKMSVLRRGLAVFFLALWLLGLSGVARADDGALESIGEHLSDFFSLRTPRVYYVAPGEGPVGVGTRENPWHGLKSAVSRLRAGDTLRLLEGIYTESADFHASGRSMAYITVEGLDRTIVDGRTFYRYDPAFDTKGHRYLRFKNLHVRNARAGVQISAGSQHVEVETLVTEQCQFALWMKDVSYIVVRGAYATDSRNAFRVSGDSHHLLIERAQGYGSKDVYKGYDLDYLNGDAFIFERGTHDVTLRDCVGADNWDAGFDIKADRARLENVVAFGNKNGLKLWGKGIVVVNALVFDSRSQIKSNGEKADGMGVNVRRGHSLILNATFVDNEAEDIKVGEKGFLELRNSIVARRRPDGKLLGDYGRFRQDRVLWYREGGETDTDPRFQNWAGADFHLTADSPAVDAGRFFLELAAVDLDEQDRVVNARVDLGAYEFQRRAPNGE